MTHFQPTPVICWAYTPGQPVTDTLFLLFSESDSDLEPVGAGIQHLQKLSQELEEAIVAEER